MSVVVQGMRTRICFFSRSLCTAACILDRDRRERCAGLPYVRCEMWLASALQWRARARCECSRRGRTT
eukprot:380304-Prorocentrum_minimum.AAC.2